MARRNKKNNLVRLVNYLDKPEPIVVRTKRTFGESYLVIEEYFKTDGVDAYNYFLKLGNELGIFLRGDRICVKSSVDPEYALYEVTIPCTDELEEPIPFNKLKGVWDPDIDDRKDRTPKSLEDLQKDTFGRALHIGDHVAFISLAGKEMEVGIITSISKSVCYISSTEFEDSIKRYCNQVSRK